MPVYNERSSIEDIIFLIANLEIPARWGLEKELIIVDDCSTDGTREVLNGIRAARERGETTSILPQKGKEIPLRDIRIIFHEKNAGKGAALKTGFHHAAGDIIAIQDADLEYDPGDLLTLIKLIVEGKADITYGSRFYGRPHRVLYFHHLLGNYVITGLINVLCNINLTDVETCYKVFKKEVLDSMRLVCDDFGFEVEFTVKTSMAKKWRLYEAGISYYGRTYGEGKKINWKDGMKALWYILKFRFLDTK
jgi:glycosyltransferase involved in cell wall biosynthesis